MRQQTRAKIDREKERKEKAELKRQRKVERKRDKQSKEHAGPLISKP